MICLARTDWVATGRRACEILTPEFINDLSFAISAAELDGALPEESRREMDEKLFDLGVACHGEGWYERLPEHSRDAWRRKVDREKQEAYEEEVTGVYIDGASPRD